MAVLGEQVLWLQVVQQLVHCVANYPKVLVRYRTNAAYVKGQPNVPHQQTIALEV